LLKPARDRATPSEPTLKHVEGDRAPALPERYRVERELGRVAWAAFSPPATKSWGVMWRSSACCGQRDEETLRRFEQEARAAALLEHPNIVAVYDIGQHESAPYIVSNCSAARRSGIAWQESLCAWKTLSTMQPSSQWDSWLRTTRA